MAVLFLVIVALFLRAYRLPEFTEYLGDQGMDAFLVYDAIMHKTIPLVGPLSSQGFHQGPVYLYLMTPSLILSRFDPLGPSFFMAILGVIAVIAFYYLAKKLFGEIAAMISAFVYAVSPIAILQSRTYWNSFLLPLSCILLLLCFTKLKEKKTLRWYLVTAFLLGIAIQLHYTGLLFLLMAFLLWFFLGLWRKPLESILSLFAFVLPLIPFLIFQAQNRFVDIASLLLRFLQYEPLIQNKPAPPLPILFGMVFENLISNWHMILSIIIGIVSIGLPILLKKTNFWHIFLLVWLLVSVLLVASNSGDFQVHYLDFLFPIPFLLFASFLKTIAAKNLDRKFVIGVGLVIILLNIIHLDTFSPTENRLARTRALTNVMIQSAENKLFSFTLISSPSFSDTHYRYLLKLQNASPKKITTNEYDTLFLICEKTPCPTKEALMKQDVQVLCYDLHCEGLYPKISLTTWEFTDEKEVSEGKLFKLTRLKDPEKN